MIHAPANSEPISISNAIFIFSVLIKIHQLNLRNHTLSRPSRRQELHNGKQTTRLEHRNKWSFRQSGCRMTNDKKEKKLKN